MNSYYLLSTSVQLSARALATVNVSYLIGGIIALLLMGYLFYTLFKPEKF